MRKQNVHNLKISSSVPLGPLTTKVLGLINENPELFAIWHVTNIVAKKRLHMTDHGIGHFQLVTNRALLLLELFHARGVPLNLQTDYQLGYDYSQVVVLLASLLHDVGMSIHRDGHEEFSLLIGFDFINKLLDFLSVKERIILRSETQHAIISHRVGGNPLTVEAGIVRVADALDLTRTRVSSTIDSKHMNIHTVSADSIDQVLVTRGKKVAVDIDIVMNHTAGLFQVDEMLHNKVKHSGIERYLDIHVYIKKNGRRQLLKEYLGRRK